MSAPEQWRLDGQVVLVTGAQRGIGFACAEAFVAADNIRDKRFGMGDVREIRGVRRRSRSEPRDRSV